MVSQLRSPVIAALAFISVAFALLPEASNCQVTRDLARTAMPSVCMLVMQDNNGQAISLGSGFIVKNGVIATNLHVIAGATRGHVKFIGQKGKLPIDGVFAIDAARDLALLAVPTPAAPPIPIGNSDSMEVGDAVYAIGNPQGLEGTFSQGIVSSIRTFGADRVLQITAPISPGSSGGPVLNGAGQVIGVAAATLQGGQNLNFAIPSKYIQPLLASITSAAPLSRNRPTTNQQSLLGNFGRKSTDGLVGEQFSWENPIFYNIPMSINGKFTFSIRNTLNEAVHNLFCLVIFYDGNDSPIDVAGVPYGGVIPGGLAKRVNGKVDGSVQQLTRKVLFRVLDFQVVE